MKTNPFSVRPFKRDIDIMLLVVRLVIGTAFIIIGWGKLQTPFTWMGTESNFPALTQSIAAFCEFGGGLALVLGLLTRLGALGVAIVMVVAVYMHMFVMKDPFINPTGGGSYQLAAAYLVITSLLIVTGPGRISLDRLLFKTKPNKPSHEQY